jgi:Nucleotidyl transferase AbiEii toxin, Type IV TA system
MTAHPISNLKASVRQRLQNISRKSKEPFDRVLSRYAVERLLYRLSQSHDANRFLLKGAMLFPLWFEEIHRPTRDVDLLGYSENDEASLERIFKKLCKRQWPVIRFKEKRGITLEEHTRIVEREHNPERKAFYKMAWHLGASQSDLASLKAEDVDWDNQGATCLVVPEGPPKPTCSLRPPESLDPKALERRGSLHEDEGYQRGHGGYQWSAPTRQASGQRLPINQYLQDHGLSQGWETPTRSATLQTPTHPLKIARCHPVPTPAPARA